MRRNLRIVGDDHEGFTLLRNECEQKIHDLLGGHAVERAGGFIRKGNRRTGNLRARNRHALCLPTGKFADAFLAHVA